MVVLDIGSKCAVILPERFINPHITPAKGLILNQLIDKKSLVLIEEVWQFKGLTSSPLDEMCFSTGTIKSKNWGWIELPHIIKDKEYMILPTKQTEVMSLTDNIMEEMIKLAVISFKKINGFI